MRKLLIALAVIIIGLPAPGVAATDAKKAAMAKKQAAAAAAQLSTIIKHFQTRPKTAIDFTKVSGELCYNAGLGKGAHMTHYAIDPAGTSEDVIDFVNAKPLLAAGINVDSLPRFPGKLNTMTPNQWYFVPANEFDPHHGKKFPFPQLIRASSLNCLARLDRRFVRDTVGPAVASRPYIAQSPIAL